MDKTYYNQLIICPWCGYKYGDSWDQGAAGLIVCEDCGKEFEFEQDNEVTYSSWKPPSLFKKPQPPNPKDTK